MYRGPFSRIYGITGDIIILEASLGELGTDIPRILGIACRGGEGGVKGLDREAAGEAALDSARASAMLHLSGECQWDLSSAIPVRN